VLIDDRVPPDEGRRPIEPNWRLIGWLTAAAVLVFAGIHTRGFVAYLILCATVYAVCRAAVSVGSYDFGLREWRQ
jgi:hypothetical protein